MFTARTILHPTDFSELAAAALEVAATLANQVGGRLILLHVGDAPMPPLPTVAGVMPQPVQAGDSGMADELRKLPLPPGLSPDRVTYQMEVGGAADVITRVARETGCDLIAMGSHGRTGLTRLLMGSVAEQVLRQAPCPVLIVGSGTRKSVDEGSSDVRVADALRFPHA